MLGYAATEGVGLATLGLPLAVLFITVGFLALSVIVARIGVARPDLDVIFVTIRRPGGKATNFPGLRSRV